MKTLSCRFLGRCAYGDALEVQERLIAARSRGETGDALLLLEHPPVVTLGRSARPEHVLLSREALAARGIGLYDSGRGGDVTYHGPGQLVGYPIVALSGERRDAHRYLRDLEEGLIAAVAAFGVAAGRVPGRTGVWTAKGKLAAIGVRLTTGWVTSHGFALNVGADLTGFDTIVPCGLRDAAVTSLAQLIGREIPLEAVADTVAPAIAAALGFAVAWPDGELAPRFAGAVSSRPPMEGSR